MENIAKRSSKSATCRQKFQYTVLTDYHKPLSVNCLSNIVILYVTEKYPIKIFNTCLALFAELASDEVAQGGAVVPPVETPFLVAAVHSNSGRWSAVEDTVLQMLAICT